MFNKSLSQQLSSHISRRSLIKSSAMAAAVTGIAPQFALANMLPKSPELDIKPSNKALVFIMLDGGNDSYNMLVPTSPVEYRSYKKSRANLALNKSSLLPLNDFEDDLGQSFGLHPAMPEVAQLFNDKRLSFVANIGPLVQPITREQQQQGTAPVPLGLMSHADQFKHWQTARPSERLNQGWMGSLADALQSNKTDQEIAMNISLAGSNIIQNGVTNSHYVIRQDGSVGLNINEKASPLNHAILHSFESLLESPYSDDPFKQNYLGITRQAQAQHQAFRLATKDARINTPFSSTELSQQLKMVARSIASAERLGQQQQTFFLRYIGWDHHDELLVNHERMLGVLSRALGEFQSALDELGLAYKVVTFTGSDFGRTLTSNGNGTDHGWGGNTLVMGNPVAGGKVLGQYPTLNIGSSNPLDIGDGVLIPTTSTDQLYAELSSWFGVDNPSLDKLFPNLKYFVKKADMGSSLGAIAS